jgi:steroid delta-isomerase-like uncharacterized protein
MPHTEAVARRFLEVWNAGGEEIVEELAARDLVGSYTHFPEPLRGVEAFRAALRETHRFFPDLRISAEEVIATEREAVVRWRYTGTHRAGELFGVPAAGRRVEVRGITIYRIESGRVREEVGVVDNLGLMAQLRDASASGST